MPNSGKPVTRDYEFSPKVLRRNVLSERMNSRRTNSPTTYKSANSLQANTDGENKSKTSESEGHITKESLQNPPRVDLGTTPDFSFSAMSFPNPDILRQVSSTDWDSTLIDCSSEILSDADLVMVNRNLEAFFTSIDSVTSDIAEEVFDPDLLK